MQNAVSSTKIIQLLADLGAASTEQLLSGLQNQYATFASAAEIAPILAKLERGSFIQNVNELWRLRVEDN